MELKVQMKIGRKDHENNENWQMAENEKKAVCKTARRAHSQKIKPIFIIPYVPRPCFIILPC